MVGGPSSDGPILTHMIRPKEAVGAEAQQIRAVLLPHDVRFGVAPGVAGQPLSTAALSIHPVR